MALERVVVNRSFTLYKTFYENGVATDPDSAPTVTVTRADDSAVATGSVTDETPDGTWSVTVAASENDRLDSLTVDWAATVNGESQEYLDTVEVAGGYLFTTAEFRVLLPESKASQAITAARISGVRTLVEQALEDVCNVAFVPRYTQQTLTGDGETTIRLKWRYIRQIRSVAIDGVAGVASDVAFQPTGIAYYASGWTPGYSNVDIGYEHGHDSPPERVRQAAMLLAKEWIVNSPVDSRATSISNDDGTFALMTPGLRGSVFGIPEVEATIQQYGLAVGVT